jgi:hypothetical protein
MTHSTTAHSPSSEIVSRPSYRPSRWNRQQGWWTTANQPSCQFPMMRHWRHSTRDMETKNSLPGEPRPPSKRCDESYTCQWHGYHPSLTTYRQRRPGKGRGPSKASCNLRIRHSSNLLWIGPRQRAKNQEAPPKVPITVSCPCPGETSEPTNDLLGGPRATGQLTNFYPGIYPTGGAPPGPAGNPFAGFSAAALTQAIQQGMSTGMAGMAGMAQGLVALAPLQTASTAGSWTPLQQAAIFKACRLPQGSAWNHPGRPHIWDEYEAEGRTSDAIGNALRAALALDYNDPAQDDVFPYIPHQVAKDIKRCQFGGDQALTAETCDRGLLPVAVQPRSIADRMIAYADEEEYDEVSFKTSSDVRSKRMKQRKYQKAPGEYHALVACLRAQCKVTEIHFGTSPLIVQLTEVHQLIKTQREFFEGILTPQDCASIIWTVSLHTKGYYDRPFQQDSTVQEPQLFLLLAELHNHRFGVPVTMPPDVVAYSKEEYAPSRQPPSTPSSDQHFGESSAAVGRHQHTPEEIKALLADVKSTHRNLTVAQLCFQAPQPVTTKDVILALGRCVDWMALGACKRSGCSYKHDHAVPSQGWQDKNLCQITVTGGRKHEEET